MRRLLLITACTLGLAAASPSAVSAGPMTGAGIPATDSASSDIQDVRLYCANRYTGRFLYWGRCGGYRPVYRPVRRRVYCYSRYTGRFLHWGYC